MQRQALVIGLGQFGMALARSLAERGCDVLAIDRDPARLAEASRAGCDAAAFDATTEDGLSRANPASRDLCICAIGDEGRESAIIVTALLRQLGARRIIARATNPLVERILLLVGAHEVVHPERAYGERLAARVFHHGIVDELPLGADLVITELRTPAAMQERSLGALDLPRRFGVSVAAVRRGEGTAVVVGPGSETTVHQDDILVLVGPPGRTQAMIERLG